MLGGVPRASARPLPSSLSDALSATGRPQRYRPPPNSSQAKGGRSLDGEFDHYTYTRNGKILSRGKVDVTDKDAQRKARVCKYSCSLTV